MSQANDIERHPWPPFIPENAKMLILGTFPPKPEKWSMDFFYPNKINDMWRIIGLIFFNKINYFWDDSKKCFIVNKIKDFLQCKKIALWDTAMEVRRLKDNASDKFLDIVTPIDLEKILSENPSIKAIVTTGEKASEVVSNQANIFIPKIGEQSPCCIGTHNFDFYRMPSTSRAYPLKLEKKADYYRSLFLHLGIID